MVPGTGITRADRPAAIDPDAGAARYSCFMRSIFARFTESLDQEFARLRQGRAGRELRSAIDHANDRYVPQVRRKGIRLLDRVGRELRQLASRFEAPRA